jgi:DNA replication licensing factor MCM5
MSGWDKGEIYHVDLLRNEPLPESNVIFNIKAKEFFENFRINQQFIYREQIASNVALGNFFVTVDLHHIQAFDEDLMGKLMQYPADTVNALENAAKELAKKFWKSERTLSVKDPLFDFQVRLTAQLQSSTISMRQLDSMHVGRFVRIPGIVISTSSVVNRPTTLHLQCKFCDYINQFDVPKYGVLGPISIPNACQGTKTNIDVRQQICPRDSLVVVPEKCQCVDQQTIKLQESPDVVPVGELPRHVILIADRSLSNSVQAGTRVIVYGIFSIFSSPDSKISRASNSYSPALRTPFIKVLGIESDFDTNSNNSKDFSRITDEEERKLKELSTQQDIYEKFSRSIAPPIFGCEDIKKALACLLFGGTRRVLTDKVRLRGDINVLLLGDPGMAKSQFLKFIDKVAPISVYTSGKGSSAAGLTASVVRDPASGDFYLEGGAMVLADGGVCCIDEFDKMDAEDRVAIHEAMEQQTISIAKAGITTILNSRTSVLAAANPVFGRYDEFKAPGDNIDFSTTILSRFDMIFIIKDEHNMQRDASMARHVLSIHQNASEISNVSGEIDLPLMKKYIKYCKS